MIKFLEGGFTCIYENMKILNIVKEFREGVSRCIVTMGLRNRMRRREPGEEGKEQRSRQKNGTCKGPVESEAVIQAV